MVKIIVQMWNSIWAIFHHSMNTKPISKRMEKQVTFQYVKGYIKLCGVCHMCASKYKGKLSNYVAACERMKMVKESLQAYVRKCSQMHKCQFSYQSLPIKQLVEKSSSRQKLHPGSDVEINTSCWSCCDTVKAVAQLLHLTLSEPFFPLEWHGI